MVKAKAHLTAKKARDKWKAKNWYKIIAPPLFDEKPVAETLADSEDKLINRVAEISMQDLTGDFRKSHIKLYFKVNKVEGSNALSHFVGHNFTSDYVRRLIRRRRSKIDGIFDVKTKDGGLVRVKMLATTEKRIQNSQKHAIRLIMKDTVLAEGKKRGFDEFIKDVLGGKISEEIQKKCRSIYPVRRVEIYKTEIFSLPRVKIKPVKKEEKPAVEKKEGKKKTEEGKKEKEKKEKKVREKKTVAKKKKSATKKKSTSKKQVKKKKE
ncbi:MAG: 30S ribosomal protein S3ae [Thermoplasmata archaeon]|nr:30S ribosomal protein S3ae [Thermoplasmata archaeon]